LRSEHGGFRFGQRRGCAAQARCGEQFDLGQVIGFQESPTQTGAAIGDAPPVAAVGLGRAVDFGTGGDDEPAIVVDVLRDETNDRRLDG